MKTIQVYDPPTCCPTGLCGNDVDPGLVSFAALLTQLRGNGVSVERFNLGQQPMAFAQNPVVRALLDSDGVEGLPVILVDGRVHLKGRYLTPDERGALARSARQGNAGVPA